MLTKRRVASFGGASIPLSIVRNALRNVISSLITVVWLCPAMVFAQVSPEDLAALRQRGKIEGWTFTIGESDASRRPLSELCGAVEPPNWRDQAVFDNRPVTRELPDSYDWRDYNGCTPIRSQGGCGSCWAFGAIGTVESMLLINDSLSADLSEQWLVSCTASGTCNGGWHTDAYEYLKLAGLTDPCGDSGIVLEADFPYTAATDPCACPYPHPYSIFSWAVVGPDGGIATVDQIKQAILDHGPVSTGVSVNSEFIGYDQGVFNAGRDAPVNHCVDLVGWDDNQGTGGVWILRNSWDTDWGMDGYMLIEYECSRVGWTTCYVKYSAQDCNGNSIPDRCEISCETPGGPCDIPGCGGSPDCNGNKIPDDCDLDSGVSTDHNTNSIPDECEPDCNGNDVPDECDVSCAGGCVSAPGCGASIDCQPDGTPDECQAAGVHLPVPGPSCSPSADFGQPWCDDFESYLLGTISGNNWEGWFGDPGTLGTVTDEQNHTPDGTNSLKIVADGPYVGEHEGTIHAFTAYDPAHGDYWLLRANVYIPSTMSGNAYFTMSPDYGLGVSWSVELKMNTATGAILNQFGPESLPLVTDAWAEIRCEIDFDADWVTVYYAGQVLSAYPWTGHGGSSNFAAVNLWSYDSSGFYYDDLSLYPGVSADDNHNGVPDECEPGIPTVSEWGLVVMSLLVLTAGTLVFMRNRRAARA